MVWSQKVNGFDNQSIDPAEFKTVRKLSPRFGQLIYFEYLVLPFKQMSLTEYERRIKKLAYVDSNEMEVITLKQLKASFKDHKDFGPLLEDKNSFVYMLMTDEFFHAKGSMKYD